MHGELKIGDDELIVDVPLDGIRKQHFINEGFKTIGDLRRAKTGDLLRLPNIGKVTVMRMRQLLGDEPIDEPKSTDLAESMERIAVAVERLGGALDRDAKYVERRDSALSNKLDRIIGLMERLPGAGFGPRLSEALVNSMNTIEAMALTQKANAVQAGKCDHEFVASANGLKRFCTKCGHTEVRANGAEPPTPITTFMQARELWR